MPVRVRNLSCTGALIEAAELPEPGTPCVSIASLSAWGTVVWVNGGKGGVQFDAPVAVSEWLPQGKRRIRQQFIDELFHQKRMRITPSDPVEVPVETELGLPAELLELRLALERTAGALALDTAVASRHPLTLQAIDRFSRRWHGSRPVPLLMMLLCQSARAPDQSLSPVSWSAATLP